LGKAKIGCLSLHIATARAKVPRADHNTAMPAPLDASPSRWCAPALALAQAGSMSIVLAVWSKPVKGSSEEQD
jgi:ferric-dicitrate binding protein FerR (iron transport regulator)